MNVIHGLKYTAFIILFVLDITARRKRQICIVSRDLVLRSTRVSSVCRVNTANPGSTRVSLEMSVV